MWKNFKVDDSKSLQENVGFSHRKDVEEALAKAHKDLQEATELYVPSKGSVLDIGCGTGLYLKDFYGKQYDLYGIDLSEEMTKEAKKHLPEVSFCVGDFMNFNFENKFDLIYSISVLEYIGRNELAIHFERLANLLNPKGIIFIHYPHALSFKDTLYPDLNYIKYSPRVVQRFAEKYFNILKHEHCFDGRKMDSYDKKEYPSANGTFKNGYLLIAMKK